jgi:SAM-dependent methyltransferase
VNDREQALSFGKFAASYESSRPGYPTEAARWALGPEFPGLSGDATGRGTVIDLGAGTGRLTRVLLPLAGRVIPVEPDPLMRAQLESSTPGVVAIAGAAEAIPSSAASVDAVVSGQAYHWFDRERAHPEIARVLRPGGTFAVLWNIRDRGAAWVADLDIAAGDSAPEHSQDPRNEDSIDFGTAFGPIERTEFRHDVPMDAARLRTLMASRSMYLIADDVERAEMDSRIAGVVAQLPPTFTMPYVTVCYRAIRR